MGEMWLKDPCAGSQQEAGRHLHVSTHSQGLGSRKADCHRAPVCLGSPPGSWHLVLPHLSARGQGPAEPLGRMGIAAQSSPTPGSPSETPVPPAGPGPAPSDRLKGSQAQLEHVPRHKGLSKIAPFIPSSAVEENLKTSNSFFSFFPLLPTSWKACLCHQHLIKGCWRKKGKLFFFYFFCLNPS